ncbi:hypothetical protein FD22_GL000724 [Loigolactobacillus coryniformis subsp. coryniformis KCTC 3167 = DSM 20001]|uniref:Uncharacterized protein n=3 Tax=Loigolactobacillus coryniformis TaxID=1610 RepID=A0A0R1FBT1_9LACO|nr:hypothetical protein FD22_GL000724 [Loigolactobacillus coryniformis subsp. coryniformis KCTC 3167 = DSM 20001]
MIKDFLATITAYFSNFYKEVSNMNNKLVCLGATVGLITASVLYLAKKTGFFEDDRHLYDEFESR